MTADITNALIRCTRDDFLAQDVFHLVREDLNLWVRELPSNLDDILSDLLDIRPLLTELRSSSSDYTLHIAAMIDGIHSLSLPFALTELAGSCGITIELIASP